MDLGRSIDYLETRPDIDARKLGFYGVSAGAAHGVRLLAVDGRFKAAVLSSGGLLPNQPAETDAWNFAPRFHVPVLMVNGRDDFLFPLDTNQKPALRGSRNQGAGQEAHPLRRGAPQSGDPPGPDWRGPGLVRPVSGTGRVGSRHIAGPLSLVTKLVTRRQMPLCGVQRRAKARGDEGEPFDCDGERRGEGHEWVNRALETAVFNRNAGRGQPVAVRLPLVAQRIAARGHDECRRQPGQIVARATAMPGDRSPAAARR